MLKKIKIKILKAKSSQVNMDLLLEAITIKR